jgi:hypothetical protein
LLLNDHSRCGVECGLRQRRQQNRRPNRCHPFTSGSNQAPLAWIGTVMETDDSS